MIKKIFYEIMDFVANDYHSGLPTLEKINAKLEKRDAKKLERKEKGSAFSRFVNFLSKPAENMENDLDVVPYADEFGINFIILNHGVVKDIVNTDNTSLNTETTEEEAINESNNPIMCLGHFTSSRTNVDPKNTQEDNTNVDCCGFCLGHFTSSRTSVEPNNDGMDNN